MNKHTLRRLIAENDLKSPDIIAALAHPETIWDACNIAEIFLDCTGYELPFSFEEWQRNVKAPVELYFRFDTRKQLTLFLKQTRKELPQIRLIF